MNMLERLMQSPIAWAILSIITIISLPLAIYSIITAKKRKEFSYVARSYSVVGKGKNMLKDFELLYKGKKIPDITITQYAIWNSGNQMLSNSDIVSDQPLSVVGKEPVQILDAHIITESEESNKFSLKTSDNTVSLDFDYAAVNEGIVLQVIHTDSRRNLSVNGKIKGGNPIKQKNSHVSLPPFGIFRIIAKSKVVAILTVIICLLIIVMGVLSLLYGSGIISLNQELITLLYETPDVSSTNEAILLGILCLILGILETILIGYTYVQEFKIGVPTKLKGYSENDYFD